MSPGFSPSCFFRTRGGSTTESLGQNQVDTAQIGGVDKTPVSGRAGAPCSKQSNCVLADAQCIKYNRGATVSLQSRCSALTLAHCLQSLCSWSLVELYRAFGSSVDAHKAVLAAHPMYANLMERALAKVVLQHVTTLEKFCQVLPPSPCNCCVMSSYHVMCTPLWRSSARDCHFHLATAVSCHRIV